MWRGTIALVALLAACGRVRDDDAVARMRARGTFRWGGDVQGGEPYVFQDPHHGGRLVGFEVEIAEALARHLGVRAEFVQNDWQTLIPSLERGDFDVALNGIEVTAARRARVAFTRPYYAFTETLVTRRDDRDVHALPNLRGRPVGTLEGSLALDLLRAEPGVRVVLYEGVEEPYLDLERGRLAAVLLDNIIAARYGLPRPALREAATVGQGVYAIALRPDQPGLLAAVDGALGASMADGELRRILERWRLWDGRQAALAGAELLPPDGGSRSGLTLAYFPLFVRGAAFTVIISVLAMAIAVTGGLVLSLARRYGAPLARATAGVYVEVFRGTPVLLQL